ncbi:MAG TPA: insulinase family protein, partial [Opitutus sp.]|nr:insulinase family protein [Opitutus sp.]
RFNFQGEAKRTGLQILWPLEGCSDARRSRQAEVMNSILNSRLYEKVREDLGAAYSPSVTFWKSDVDPNDGYLIAYISVKPRQAKRITELMLEIADSFSREGATADEFERAIAPILARAATEQKENGYWLWHVIPRAQTHPEVLQWPLTRLRDLEAMTVNDINALATSVLPATRAIKFSAVVGPK